MDSDSLADVVFVIEGTAINGAYINELKTNYIMPTLEHFTQGPLDVGEYLISERHATRFGIVLYRTAANLLEPMCSTYGPFTSPQKVMDAIDRLPLIGGGMESYATMAEGFATAHCCFDDMNEARLNGTPEQANVQRHCILICNSPPYSMPVISCWKHVGKTVEQLAALFHERKINFSIIAPRKIPNLFKLFVKADGDQPLTAKNYAKNIRHLVLLKGYYLKERTASPNANVGPAQNQMVAPGGNNQTQQQQGPMAMDASLAHVQPHMHTGMGVTASQQQQSMSGMNPQLVQQQQQLQQFANQNPNQNTNFQPNVSMNPQNRWLFPPNQQQPGQQRPPFIGGPGAGMPGGPVGGPMAGNQGIPGQNPNSALISQLSAPPNQNINPLLQQQQQMRMQMLNQQQQQQQHQQQLQQQLQHQLNQQQQQQNQTQQQQPGMNIGGPPNAPSANPMPVGAASSSTSDPTASRDREKIWSGTLEWIEKTKPDQQKIPRTLQCTVTTNTKEGEPEIKADNWPPKLLMQLMPKHLVGNIGGQFLKDSKMVVFRPLPCEALEALAKVMTTGFAGCVHFTTAANMPACDIKVLILLYTAEKNAFLGFIPNSQTMFVERLRKVIQQKQQGQQQGNIGGSGGMQQQQQQQMQNTMGAQMPNSLPPNVLAQQQQQQQKGISMEVQQMQQEQQQQQHYNQYAQQMNLQQMGGPCGPGGPLPGGGGGGSAGGQISEQMSGSPVGNPMQQHQQQMSMLQQRMPLVGGGPNAPQQMPSHAAAAAAAMQQQQQRMVRPMMSNNPGLRHLLQQQSTPGNQFRPPMGGPGGPMSGPPNQMGGAGGGLMGPNRPFDETNFDFM